MTTLADYLTEEDCREIARMLRRIHARSAARRAREAETAGRATSADTARPATDISESNRHIAASPAAGGHRQPAEQGEGKFVQLDESQRQQRARLWRPQGINHE